MNARRRRHWNRRVRVSRPILPAVAGTTLVAALLTLVLVALPGAHVLSWMKSHWLNAVAITALATIAAALMPLIIRQLDRRQADGARRSDACRRQAREREVMLRRVRNKWITGVLEPSLAGTTWLALGLQRRPDVLNLGERVLPSPGRQPGRIPDGKQIVEVFDQVGEALLILGAPGMGKTTRLLQLARELLDRAEAAGEQPIPVVMNLAPWAILRQPLAAWLPAELAAIYKIRATTAEAWLMDDRFVLLLDGLDEVAEPHRADCVAAINAYRRDHGTAGLAICSRTQELQELGIRLDLEEAVELQPPHDAAIDAYLSGMETARTLLADLRAAVVTDQTLRDLLRSPLMLHVIAHAYHGQPALTSDAGGNTEQRHEQVWQAYLTRMFELHPLDPACGYTTRQAQLWLTWLARAMRDRDQAEFHLDRLNFTWIPAESSGFPAALRGLLPDENPAEMKLRIQTAHELHVSWKWMAQGFFKGLLYGISCSLFAAWIYPKLPQGGSPPMTFGARVTIGLWYSLLWGLSLGLFEGLITDLREEQTVPNEGVRRAAMYALVTGLPTGLIVGLAAALAFGRSSNPAVAMANVNAGLFFGIGTALIAGWIFGGRACLRHYLVRAALTRVRAAPWHYQAFLDAMTERLLLRRTGSGYLFLHPLLAEHLAKQHASPALAAEDMSTG